MNCVIIMQGRFWCVTLNNPREILDPSEWPGCAAAIWQLEMGDNGTPHYQLYVEFQRNVRMNRLLSMSGLRGAHVEIRRGNKEQAIVYHTKEESRLEGPFYWPSAEVARQRGMYEAPRDFRIRHIWERMFPLYPALRADIVNPDRP